ncbi:SusC/RagA family TonB-linked outer membrane protein [Nonlabens xiamenensis]|uniref:SusC/RagA family TonB-linked outer membrane protein n=1 Tax=Nonlabens xiamenensis TaxID=2341043 RepID=UPI000F60B571|nr:SusC/RagA family TonB-linked outer membrane protein [Nonlabens xiamenensis]
MPKLLYRVVFVLFINLLGHIGVAQQQRQISGRVLDDQTREAIFGANVLIKGTNQGTVTDVDGTFTYTIRSADINATVLIIRYLGYKTKEVTVGERSKFQILLSEDVEALDAVVLTSSYGTKKLKEEVVGSISTVNTEDLSTEQPATSVDELLEGQVAGVLIESNPQLGEPVRIDIRGQGSLTPLGANVVGTSTQPLIIVDGVILPEEIGIDGNAFFDAGTGRLSENFLNPLARVGIQDIESINVLKDAAAVGIYGANAANGVILITTKKGKKGSLSMTAGIQGGYSQAFDQIQYLSGEQFNEIRNLYNANNEDFNNIRPWNGVDTDWFDILNRDASFVRYNVGATYGNSLFRFRGSLTYQQREEPQVNNNFDQINSSFSADYAGEKLNVGIRFSPSFTSKNNPNVLNNFAVDPTIPVRDDTGAFTPFPNIGNPVAVAQQNKSLAETFSLLGSLNLSYELSEDWQLNSLYGFNLADKDEDKFFSGLNGSGILNSGDLGRRILRERNTSSWNWNASLNFSKTYAQKNNAEAIFGVETRGEQVDFGYIRAQGFTDPGRIQSVDRAAEIDRQQDTAESYGRSGFTQLNYNYDKTYFFLANFRVDQSSTFGTDNNTALNGGLGASWVLSREDFLINSNSVDFLRLRLSYGTTGNSRIGSYRSLGLYAVDLDNDGYNGLPNATPTGDGPNPNLGWEKNNKFNIGIDFNTLGRFKMTLEYFRDAINDIIVSRQAIPESGYDTVQINGASMINQGIEYSLAVDFISTENLNWSANFNIATLTNEVTSLSGLGSNFSSSERARAQQIGFATSTIWGFPSLGIDPATGNELFLINGQVYDAAFVRTNFDEADWTPIGDSQPDFYGGLRSNLSYKDLSLSVIMSYSYGGDQLISRNIIDGYNVLTNRNLNSNTFFDAWRNPGDIAFSQAPSNVQGIINSSRYVYDSSNIQLKSVSLAYNFPTEKWKLPVKTLSINANGSNLYYWFNEDAPEGRNGIAEFRNVYPQMRTFSLGINTSF